MSYYLTEVSDQQARQLRLWNLIMGILHLGQGLFMWFVSSTQTFQTVLNLPTPNVELRSVTLEAENFWEINLGYAIASFLLMSAVAHFLTITPGIWKWYLKNLSHEMNLIRWWEYALSSSVMICVIAALSFINDASILFLIFVTNACMNLFGAMMEKHNSALKEAKGLDYKTDWTGYIYGVIAGIAPWIVTGIYFFVTIDRVGSEVEVPDFVYWIFPTLSVFFNLFAINMFLQYMKWGPWKNYLFGEKTYIFLSLAAKTVLAWIIWGGTLRP
jgi:hypothetical protein